MELEESTVSIVAGKGGLTAWIWRCFRKESGPNGAGAVEGVVYVNALAVLAPESTDTLWGSAS